MTSNSQFDFTSSLRRIQDARAKRGTKVTRKLINALSRENHDMPSFNHHVMILNADVPDDDYSNELLTRHGTLFEERVAKWVTPNGNCLFNSASVALAGKY